MVLSPHTHAVAYAERSRNRSAAGALGACGLRPPFVWRSWGKVSGVVLDVVISLFLALAIEPVVLLLVRHGWKRGVASAVSLIGLGAVIVALLALFGNMFVQQAISMVKGLPGVYDEISRTSPVRP